MVGLEVEGGQVEVVVGYGWILEVVVVDWLGEMEQVIEYFVFYVDYLQLLDFEGFE